MEENQFDSLDLLQYNPAAYPESENVDDPVDFPGRNEAEPNVEEVEAQPPNSQHLEEIHEESPEVTTTAAPDIELEGTSRRRRELCPEDRLAAYNMLLQKSVNGKLKKKTTKEVAEYFNVHIRSIQRLWKKGRDSDNHNISLQRVKNCGRKRIEFDLQKIRDIPLRDRTTLKSLAAALGVSKTFLQSRLKSGELRRHSNAIKPILTDGNRVQRVRHCLSMIDPSSLPEGNCFYDMQNVVHIDEKWFLMTKKIQTYYLLADEDDPVRAIKSTNFIPKIMFLVAIARPRYDSSGYCTFDGKIGVFPLVTNVAAVRSSSNRVAGTLEVKAIAKIDRAVMRHFMIEHVLPAIKDKWPKDSLMDQIIIQQDNAKTHIHEQDIDFLSAAEKLGLDIVVSCQPPNSPDLNVLDLGFFRAIQSLQEKKCAKNLKELVEAVTAVYFQFSDVKANNIFITLQSCMLEILKINGSNVYRIPHMKKRHLDRFGLLPSILSCDPVILATATAKLPLLPCKKNVVCAICTVYLIIIIDNALCNIFQDMGLKMAVAVARKAQYFVGIDILICDLVGQICLSYRTSVFFP